MSKEQIEKHLQKLVNKLSKHEREVLARVLEGLTNKEISEKYFIASATVKVHRASIYRKLKVN